MVSLIPPISLLTCVLLVVGCCVQDGRAVALPATKSRQPMGCLDDCAEYGLGITGTYQNYSAVPNGEVWLDTDGNAIQAQGGGFLKVGPTYYWAGQDKTPSLQGLPSSEALVNLYSSTDLMNWVKVGVILSKLTPDVNGNQLLTYCNIERPKLLYNEKTRMFVLWAHWEEHSTYDASHVITATAPDISGPYTVTRHGHRRPGAGNSKPDAMGDRIGSLIVDYNTAAKNASDGTHPLMPVASVGYPPTILQFQPPSASDSWSIKYVDQNTYGTAQVDNWWTYQLTDVQFNLVLKAVAVNMTDYDTKYYDEYAGRYAVKPEDYIVRYPTSVRSRVVMANFTVDGRASVDNSKPPIPPLIGPGLRESSSPTVVYLKSGDAAFITQATNGNAILYFTTDGTDPRSSMNSSRYWAGTRIVLSGGAGTKMVVSAISTSNGQNSSVVTQTYEIAADASSVPIFEPIINFPSGVYESSSEAFGYESMRIYSPSYGTNCYYTMDGLDPNPPSLGENAGFGSKDMTVFQDPKTDKAYLISAQDNVFGRLWQLSDDFTDVVPELEYDVWTNVSREAPALVRHGGAKGQFVYLLTSTQTGYFPNQGQYMRTSDLSAGFNLPRDAVTGYRDGSTLWSDLQPFGDSSTYYSQSTFVLDIGATDKPEYLFMGDRYNTVAGYRSTFVWMPLTIDDDAPSQTGVNGSGYVQVEFYPTLQIDVEQHQLLKPSWKLLSLNRPVSATPSKALSAQQRAAGTFNFSAEAANDGRNYDVNVYDDDRHFYCPVAVPFYWRVDLGEVHSLSWIGLSFMSIGGSDAAYRYTIAGSADGKHWVELVDNTRNLSPGFMNHNVDGRFRYVQLNDLGVEDVDHNKEADWEVGLYQVSVYGI